MDDPIDLVYLWVDGGDPGFRKGYQQALQVLPEATPESRGAHRFRNWNELKYSLRSVASHAPWVRKIHLVTNGQVPDWLNVDHEKVALVTHDQIFPDGSHLPTFNSNAIEMHLHRIPGLADRFLYFNDDLFLGRPITPGDFLLAGGGQKYYYEKIPLHRDMKHGRTHDRAYAFTADWMNRQRWGEMPAWLPAHCPQLYQRDLLHELAQLFSEHTAATSSHRFRTGEDWVLRVAYSGYLFRSEPRPLPNEMELLEYGGSAYTLICLEDNFYNMARAFLHVLLVRPRFFCINDDLDEKAHGMIPFMLRLFLHCAFPQKSVFEK